jgi:hypothetical protein
MKKNQKEQPQEGFSHEPPDYKSYGDYNFPDSSQDIDMPFPDDDDDSLSYYTLMDSEDYQDFED